MCVQIWIIITAGLNLCFVFEGEANGKNKIKSVVCTIFLFSVFFVFELN